mmetsp:Transcript_30260/g.65053  ORF Transcript_30260/g.65053 Transcript_30260/m.65053 type:complete len:215 (+) Transcript_30260:943-1587(+)
MHGLLPRAILPPHEQGDREGSRQLLPSLLAPLLVARTRLRFDRLLLRPAQHQSVGAQGGAWLEAHRGRHGVDQGQRPQAHARRRRRRSRRGPARYRRRDDPGTALRLAQLPAAGWHGVDGLHDPLHGARRYGTVPLRWQVGLAVRALVRLHRRTRRADRPALLQAAHRPDRPSLHHRADARLHHRSRRSDHGLLGHRQCRRRRERRRGRLGGRH